MSIERTEFGSQYAPYAAELRAVEVLPVQQIAGVGMAVQYEVSQECSKNSGEECDIDEATELVPGHLAIRFFCNRKATCAALCQLAAEQAQHMALDQARTRIRQQARLN